MSQGLILLGLYGTLLPSICGAYLGGSEWDWGTRPWRLVVDGAEVLWSARVLVLAWILLEPLSGFYAAPELARFLPMWNAKVVHHSLFPNREGTLAVIVPTSGNAALSALSVAGYLLTALILSFSVRSRRDH